MPWLSEATKDVTSCDKPRRGANTRIKRGFPNGATRRKGFRRPGSNAGGRTRGTETSQYPEEKKETSIASVAASESATAQTAVVRKGEWRGCRAVDDDRNNVQQKVLENTPAEGERPVSEDRGVQTRRYLSKAGHEESCPKPRGPSRKAKYYRETDSEPVP